MGLFLTNFLSVSGIFFLLHFGFAIVFSLRVLSRRERLPSFTVAWILSFFLVPVFSIVLYMLTGYHNMRRRRRSKPNPSKRALTSARPVNDNVALSPELQKVARLAERLTEFPVRSGNTLQLYEDAFGSFDALTEAMNVAQHHIHLEYYIFQSDESGARFRNILIEKAKAGIECRVLLDHVGSYHLRDEFLRPMREAGVRIAFFWPLKIARPWGFNLRNHRKIAVIDGKIGFVGSQNIGNEYSNWKNRKLSWRDTLIKIIGRGVGQLQVIFTEDWAFTTGENLSAESYFPELSEVGASQLQILPTGPDEHDGALEEIVMSLIHTADKRITLLTPYFIPTPSIVLALDAAAARGIQIDVLSPGQASHWLLNYIAQGWYRDLLRSGAHLYEYSETFLHAKVVTIDDRVALVGSANMDERSFRLNFECSVLLYDSNIVTCLVESFDTMKNKSRVILLEEVEHQWFWRDVRDGLFRILSPLF